MSPETTAKTSTQLIQVLQRLNFEHDSLINAGLPPQVFFEWQLLLMPTHSHDEAQESSSFQSLQKQLEICLPNL